jgi:hypothetical protein
LFTPGVVPTTTLLLFTQLYVTGPTALLTTPAETEPVLLPLHNALSCEQVVMLSAAGSLMVTVQVSVKQLSLTVKVYVPAGRLFTVAVVPTTTLLLFSQL